MRRTLQPGIYWGAGARAPGFFAIVFLGASKATSRIALCEVLDGLWGRYGRLQEGIGDGGLPVPKRGLRVLVGFGRRAFELAADAPDAAGLPDAMDEHAFNDPDRVRARIPIAPDSAIFYEPDATSLGDAAVALQFTASTATAVERAVVETSKHLFDAQSGEDDTRPWIIAAYIGSRRDDGRSWIDFHDGASNLARSDRRSVIRIPSPDDPAAKALIKAFPDRGRDLLPGDADRWTVGGTYLAYMRLYIDLAAWQRLDVRSQEVIVGRRRLTGVPLASEDREFPQSPVDERSASAGLAPPHEADPNAVAGLDLSAAIRTSHIQRANHHTDEGGIASPTNHRIFRQGYPFFETAHGGNAFRVGLNFASFQWRPGNLFGMLRERDWLGGANFGGSDDLELLSAGAAGVFLVPPCDDEAGRFPGRRALLGSTG